EAPAATDRAPRHGPSQSLRADLSPGGRAGAAARRPAYPESVERLISEVSRLPGIGRRSAERLVLHGLKYDACAAMGLDKDIQDVKFPVSHCPGCYNLTDAAPCKICADEGRDRATVLVVEQPKDLIALEQTGMYRGVYHVL